MVLLLQADWILLQAAWPQVRRRHQPWRTFPPQVVLHSLSWRKAYGGMVSRVLMCPHIVPPALVGCTLDGRHSVLDKGFQLLGIFLYPGQHNLGVNPVIAVGFFHLENGGNLGQQLELHQTSQELQSGHGDRLHWSYPGLGCHQGHSDGGIFVEDSGIDHSSIASFTGVSEAVLLHSHHRREVVLGQLPRHCMESDVLDLFYPGDKLVCHILKYRIIPCSACYPELLEETRGLNQGRRIPAYELMYPLYILLC